MKIIDKIVNKIPARKFNGERGEKIIHWFGENISTPENRLIIGVTALMSQPFIDLYNKDVDEKTRIVSCARTTAKIVAGTILGVTIRGGLIKLTQKYSKLGEAGTKKINKLFTPPSAPEKMTYSYKQYQNAMGMILAVGAMVLTSFALEGLSTKYLTNVLMKRFTGKKQESKGGINATKNA